MFTERETEIMRVALSFMLANLEDVCETHDMEFSEKEVKELEQKMYEP